MNCEPITSKSRWFYEDVYSPASSNFFPHFQPIINVSSGEIAGYEALARCHDPDGKVVSAASTFYDPRILRSTKLTIDRAVREAALKHAAKHADAGFISLNISPDWIDILGDTAASPTITMMKRLKIPPERVVIEVTERDGNLNNLKRLTDQYHRAGMRIAIDDFGTGASQIDRLIALKPEFIKLDRALFRAAATGGHEANVVLALADIAQRSGCKIVCEGIETEEEFHFAIECGADYIQGWLFQAAEQELKARKIYADRIMMYKNSYLQRKSQRHIELIRHNQDVNNEVKKLCVLQSVKTPFSDAVTQLNVPRLHELGILRFYICDHQGQQLSPNYEIEEERIVPKPSVAGQNWCHRAYFPLLKAMIELETDHIVVSDAYKDIVSDKMCKTFGVYLGPEEVLLIDVLSLDHVLFL